MASNFLKTKALLGTLLFTAACGEATKIHKPEGSTENSTQLNLVGEVFSFTDYRSAQELIYKQVRDQPQDTRAQENKTVLIQFFGSPGLSKAALPRSITETPMLCSDQVAIASAPMTRDRRTALIMKLQEKLQEKFPSLIFNFPEEGAKIADMPVKPNAAIFVVLSPADLGCTRDKSVNYFILNDLSRYLQVSTSFVFTENMSDAVIEQSIIQVISSSLPSQGALPKATEKINSLGTILRNINDTNAPDLSALEMQIQEIVPQGLNMLPDFDKTMGALAALNLENKKTPPPGSTPKGPFGGLFRDLFTAQENPKWEDLLKSGLGIALELFISGGTLGFSSILAEMILNAARPTTNVDLPDFAEFFGFTKDLAPSEGLQLYLESLQVVEGFEDTMEPTAVRSTLTFAHGQYWHKIKYMLD